MRVLPALVAPVFAALLGLACLLPGRALACDMDSLAADYLKYSSSLTFEGSDDPQRGSVRSGETIAIDWAIPAAATVSCIDQGRNYFVLYLPDSVRIGGTGFTAYRSGDAGPFGFSAPEGRIAVLAELTDDHFHGRIEVTPHMTGEVRLDWGILAILTQQAGLEESAIDYGGQNGPALTLDIRPGSPVLLAQDRFDLAEPLYRVAGPGGRYRLAVSEGGFRVTDAATGALLLAEPGDAPRFSPTGRFLTWFTEAFGDPDSDGYVAADPAAVARGEDVWVYDLDAGKLVYRTPLDGDGMMVLGIDWSPSDSFLALQIGGNCRAVLVQTLIDGRNAQGGSGPTACDPVSDGMTRLTPARDAAYVGYPDYGFDAMPLDGIGTVSISDADMDAPSPQHELAGGLVRTLSWLQDDPLFRAPEATTGPEESDLPEEDILATTRGGLALGGRINSGLDPSSFGVRMADRLSALNIPMQPSRGPITPQEPEVQFYDNEHPDAGPPGVDRWVYTGDLVPGATAAQRDALNRLSAPLMGDWTNCDLTPWSRVRVWTWQDSGLISQIIAVDCAIGTGMIPDGVLAWARVDADGTPWMRIIGLNGVGERMRSDEERPAGDPDTIVGLIGIDPYDDIAVHDLGQGVLGIVGQSAGIAVVDVRRGAASQAMVSEGGLGEVVLLNLSPDWRQLIRGSRDGRIAVHDLMTGKVVRSGAYLDDEVVLFRPDGRFAATQDGARYALIRFPGERLVYRLDQFRALAKGDGPVDYAVPPRIARTETTRDGDALTIDAWFDDAGSQPVRLEVFRDGARIGAIDVEGGSAGLEVTLHPETRWVTLQAVDAQGLVSAPVPLAVEPQPDIAPEGRLFVLAVGTDRYDDPALGRLAYAVHDARTLADALRARPPAGYASVTVETLEDSPDLATRLPKALADLAARTGPGDTVILHVAGHGLLDQAGAFRLATRETRMDDVAGTALAFSDVVGALSKVQARVLVLLDACHSGAAEEGEGATNDDAVSVLASTGRIAVLAASKGRQYSLESAAWGGGLFTAELVKALDGGAQDANGNGRIELDELYLAVKRGVARASGGAQTPWMLRAGLVGAVPLF